MRTMTEFGKYVSEQRKKAGLTQESFAARLGITPQAVSKWETGVGYPDITLFPEIARVLNVGLDSLFGEAPRGKQAEFAPAKQGMPLVHKWQDRGCYSSKQVAAAEEDRVTFTDGSTAVLSTRTVTNLGRGEILIAQAQEYYPALVQGPTELKDSLEPFHSVSIEVNGSWDCEMLRGDEFSIEAQGPAEFIASIEYSVTGGKLSLKNKNVGHNISGEKKVRVCVGFGRGKELSVAINGSGDFSAEPDFDSAELRVSGSGDISCRDLGDLTASVAGSGDISLGECQKAKLSIAGSGDVNAKSALSPEISIAGSGDVELKKVSGDGRIKIAGSGGVTLSGELDSLYCEIAGSGGIDGSGLTVTTAELYAEGSAGIELGRIKKSSVERLSEDSVLKVGRRGE